MLVITMGPPSPFTQWGVHIVRATLTHLLGSVDVLVANRIDDLRAAWSGRRGEHVMLFGDNPDAEIVDLVRPSGLGVIAFIEEPRDVVAYAISERGISWQDAVRVMTLSLSAIHDVYLMPSALVINRSAKLRVSELVERIADRFNLSIQPAQFDEILRQISVRGEADREETLEEQILGRFPMARPMGSAPSGVGGDEFQIIDATCESYRCLLEGQPVTRVVWARQMLSSADSPSDPPNQQMDITGPARYLFFGPYLHLPLGAWMAEMHFSIDENQSGNAVHLDVFNQSVLSKGTARLPAVGDYRYDLPFKVENPIRPLEFRLLMTEGAIEGVLALQNIVMRRNEIARA